MTTMISAFLAMVIAGSDQDEPDRWGWGMQPIIGYDDESGMTLGANSVFYGNPDPANPAQELDELNLVATWSYGNAYNVNTSVLKNLDEGDKAIEAAIGCERSHQEFHGIGPDSPENGVAYDALVIPFRLAFPVKIFDHLYASPHYDFRDFETMDAEDDVVVPPVPPDSRSSGIGLSLVWKSTNPGLYKRRGCVLSMASTKYHRRLGSDAEFEVAEAGAKLYVPVMTESVLGFQMRMESADGDVPLPYMPTLGGHKLLRGFDGSRYVGHRCAAGQAEFRFPIWWRLGGTLFAGAGEVAEGYDRFGRNIRFAGGAGLRFMVQTRQKINIRLDFAWNDALDNRKYLKLKEAF